MKLIVFLPIIVSIYSLLLKHHSPLGEFNFARTTIFSPQQGMRVWVWDENPSNARLTKDGTKKLATLRIQLKNNTEAIKKRISASDFEYLCKQLIKDNPKRCPTGSHFGAKESWVGFKDVCNQPNYCPNVPGL